MDLSKIKPVERLYEILHPATGEEVGITVGIMSLDDDRLRTIKRQIQDKKTHLEARGKSFTAKQIEENQRMLVFTAMTSWEWRGDANWNNEIPAFNQKNVFEIFETIPWFLTQLSNEIGLTESFFSK